MPAVSDKDKALQYIESHNVMSIATLGPEYPWNTAVFYVSVGFELFFVSSPDSRHCQNISRNANIAVTIQEDYFEWQTIKGIQMDGTVESVPDDQRQYVIKQYKNKFSFLQDQNRTPADIIDALEKGAWYRILPRKVFYIDNEKGFGHRVEIPVNM